MKLGDIKLWLTVEKDPPNFKAMVAHLRLFSNTHNCSVKSSPEVFHILRVSTNSLSWDRILSMANKYIVAYLYLYVI